MEYSMKGFKERQEKKRQERRKEKEQEEGLALHEKGEAFAWQLFRYDTDLSIGFVEHGEFPVVVLTSPQSLTGICMTVDDAEQFAKELLGEVQNYRVKGTPLESFLHNSLVQPR